MSNQFPASALATYRPDIDGLRALAVLSVVAYHAFPDRISGGFVGVDVFFVISGYLISSIVFEGVANGTFTFKGFYARRIRRIFPALTVVLATCITAGWYFLIPGEYKQLGKHIAGGAGFVSNFILLKEAGYFDPVAETKPLLHLWSLGIEEQFYLLWPLFTYLAWRRIRLPFLVAAVLLTSFALNVVRIDGNSVGVFYSPVTRFWELLVGATLALWHHQKAGKVSRLSGTPLFHCPGTWMADGFAAIGLVLVAGAIVGLDSTDLFPGWWALLPTIGAALLISAGPDTWINRRLFANSSVIWIGLISYPLYLWHWPLLTFARILQSGTPSHSTTLTALGLSLVLAAGTYRFIERPLRFGAKRGLKAVALCITMFALGLAGYLTVRHNGFPDRANFAEYENNRDALVEDVSSHNRENCTSSPAFDYQRLNKDFFCMRSRDSDTLPRNVIVGDSHAFPMYFGFYDLVVKQRNEDLLMLGAPGCPPFLGLESFEKGSTDKCRVIMDDVLNKVANSANVKTVILVNRGPLYTQGTGYGRIDKHHRILRRISATASESNHAAYQGALAETIRTLRAHGKNVVLVLPPPELGFEPTSCVRTRPVEISPRNLDNCGISLGAYLDRTANFRSIVSSPAIASQNIFVVDAARAICDEAYCRAYSSGRFLYSDNNHLSTKGARLVVENQPIPY